MPLIDKVSNFATFLLLKVSIMDTNTSPNVSIMEATLKIPLGSYLDPDALDRFVKLCAGKNQSASDRIASLILKDIESQEEPAQEPKEEEAK